MQFKNGYRYDEAGYLVCATLIQPSPLEPGKWLMPKRCTEVKPGEDQGFFYRFDGVAWIAEKKPTCAADFEGIVISHTSQTPHDKEMRSLIQKHCEGSQTHRIVRGDDLSWTVEVIPELTPEERMAKAEQEARSKRDYLISQTDYLLAPDYPITAESLEAVKEYRQALRDVPQQAGFPDEIDWPTMPEVQKV